MDQSSQKPVYELSDTQTSSSRSSLSRWLLTIAGSLFSLSLIYFLLQFANPGASIFENILVTVLVGFFPISYLAFEVRAGHHKDRLVSRINLLGFADKDEQDRWEKLYRQINPPQEYILFVTLASLISLFGFVLLRFSSSDLHGLDYPLTDFVFQTMFYSFLGGYIFAIYNVSRRYMTYDMAPGVYLQSTVLLITVLIIGLILALFLQDQREVDQQILAIPSALIPILAFLIGYIPDSGIRLMRSLSDRIQKVDDRREINLGEVDGISIWHETRLRESGVDNVQNLAAMDIRQLLLTSRYSMPQVMNWVDQAILLTTLPQNTIKSLRQIGITTMTALIRLLEPVPPAEPEQIRLVPIDENEELSHEELVMLASLSRSFIESSPNLAYVQAYWNAIRQVETEQIRAQTQNVLADITRLVAKPVFANDRTLDLLTSLVNETDLKPEDLTRAFAKDAASAVGLANAYIENASYQVAIDILTRAIHEYRDRDEDLSPAYASRGLARGSLAINLKADDKEYARLIDESDKDFKEATKANPRYPVTYIYRGALLLQRKELPQALAALDQAVELDPTIPKAYLTRGKIYGNLNQYDLAIDDYSEAIKLAKARDLQRIMEDAYYERATLFLNSSKLEEAKSDFDEEILLDSQNPQAYLGRGKTLLLRGSKMLELGGTISYPILFLLSRAINDFEVVIELYRRRQKSERRDQLDPNAALAYSNIAQAYFQLEQYIDAVANVQKAIELNDQSLINLKVRGLSYIKIGELEKALGDLTQYMTNLPKDSTERPALQVIIEQVQKKLASQAVATPPAENPPAG